MVNRAVCNVLLKSATDMIDASNVCRSTSPAQRTIEPLVTSGLLKYPRSKPTWSAWMIPQTIAAKIVKPTSVTTFLLEPRQPCWIADQPLRSPFTAIKLNLILSLPRLIQHLQARRQYQTVPTAIASLALFGIPIELASTAPAHAGWDLEHAGAVEDLLGDYIRTLPGGETMELPRLFIYQGQAFSRACPRSGIDSPAYCPGDHTVYLEITLGSAVPRVEFSAPSHCAHEFGHAYLFEQLIHQVKMVNSPLMLLPGGLLVMLKPRGCWKQEI